MKKVAAVIFDLDGTIANTLPLCIAAFRKSVEPLINRAISDEEIIATFGPSEEGTIMALAPNHYDKGVNNYLQHYQHLHNMCPAPFEGIVDLLNTLKEKNIPVAMVTGKGLHSTEISLKHFGLSGYFSPVETGSPKGPRKVEGIQLVLNEFGNLEKDTVIYVGDAPSDIIASKEVGIPVVAAAWAATAEPDELKKLHPDEIFYSIKDFSDWLIQRI